MPESTEIPVPCFPKETAIKTDEVFHSEMVLLWSLWQLQSPAFCVSEANVVILKIWMWFLLFLLLLDQL